MRKLLLIGATLLVAGNLYASNVDSLKVKAKIDSLTTERGKLGKQISLITNEIHTLQSSIGDTLNYQIGPRGGKYYINSNGRKVYVKKN